MTDAYGKCNSTVCRQHLIVEPGLSAMGPPKLIFGVSPHLPGLDWMPKEIFEQICKNLDAISLVNLSTTCKAMRARLSFPQGNMVWYEVMPTSIWNEKEMHQDEIELAMIKAVAIIQPTAKAPAFSNKAKSSV